MRGRVMEIWTLIFGGMIPLDSLEAGLLADFIGTPATMAIDALICALAALVTLHVIAGAKRNWLRPRSPQSFVRCPKPASACCYT
jgi:hypothetical protein